jgi:hypothetical protein
MVKGAKKSAGDLAEVLGRSGMRLARLDSQAVRFRLKWIDRGMSK